MKRITLRSSSAGSSRRLRSLSPQPIYERAEENVSPYNRPYFEYFHSRARSQPSPNVPATNAKRFYISSENEARSTKQTSVPKPSKITKERAGPVTIKLQPRNTTPMATSSINFNTFAPEEPFRLPADKVKQLKYHANTQYSKAVKALNKKSEETTTYRYQLDAAKPKDQVKMYNLYEIFRTRQETKMSKIRQLQPKNIKPYGNVTNIHWPSNADTKQMQVVYPEAPSKLDTKKRVETDGEVIKLSSASTQHRDYCTLQIKAEENEMSSELEKCNNVLADIKKANPDYTNKSLILMPGTVDERKFLEKSDKLVNDVKVKHISEDLQKCNRLIAQNRELNAGFIVKKQETRTTKDEKDVLKDITNFAEEAKQKMFDVNRSGNNKQILLYYEETPSGGNKVLRSKINKDGMFGAYDAEIVRYRTVTRANSTPIKIKVGPKLKLQSGKSEVEPALNPGVNEKFTVPWPSYAEKVKHSRNFTKRKNPCKVLRDQAIKLSTNTKVQLLGTKESVGEAATEKAKHTVRNLSNSSASQLIDSRNTESKRQFSTGSSNDLVANFIDESIRSFESEVPCFSYQQKCDEWISLWNSANGTKRADDICVKKNFVKTTPPYFETRAYSTNTKHGVLGPEGTVMVKLPRLPKIKIPEPKKVCPEDLNCPERADGPIKVKPRKLPKMTPSNCPPASKPCMAEGTPLKPPKQRSKPKNPMHVCPLPPICPPRADAGMKILPKQLPKIEPGDCPDVPQPEMYTPPLPRLIPKPVPEQPCKKPPCVGKECCPPRADEGLKVERKCLPPVVAADCPKICPNELKPGKPLKKPRKMHIPEPKKECKQVCIGKECCPPRADKVTGYKLKKKRLKTLILCEKNNNMSAKEFNSQMEKALKRQQTKRRYSTNSKCSMCCYSDKKVQPDVVSAEHQSQWSKFYDYFRPTTTASDDVKETGETDSVELRVIKKRIGNRSDQLFEREKLLNNSFSTLVNSSKKYCTGIPKPFFDKLLFRNFSDSKSSKDGGDARSSEPEDCPCVENKPSNRPQPKLRRLPKPPFEDRPPWKCQGQECNPRSDKEEDLYVRKSLPVLKVEDCPCVEKEQYNIPQPVLKRLPKPPFEDRPDWECRDYCKKVCGDGPRSDEGKVLYVRKTLPPLELKDCPCVEKQQYNIPQPKLRRLPKPPFEDRPDWECRDYCKKVCGDGPRSDEGKELYARKKLPSLPLKDCPCAVKEQYNIPQPILKRLPKPPFEDRPDWECRDYCKKVCGDGPRSDEGKVLYVRKTLPPLESKDCPCVEKQQYNIPQPKLRRLPKPPFEDRPDWECRDYCKKVCGDGPRSDEGKELYVRKKLPSLQLKDCPCAVKEQYNIPQPILKRLPKPPFEDRPDWECRDYCKKVCGDGPRSDEGKVLYVRKTLPPLESKDCPCVEKQQYNIPQPKLRRLPKPPFEDRPDWECRDYCKKVCGDGPRSDEGKELYVRKKLPSLLLKDCPCAVKEQYNIPQPILKRLPKPPFEDRPDWECRDYCKKVCGDGPRSDEGKVLYVRKTLPPLESKDCPCVEKQQYNIPQPKLRRLPKPPFEDRPDWECRDYCKKVCGDGPRSDEGKELYVRKKLPSLLLKDCPCAVKEQYNIPQPILKRLPKPPFEDRPDWECRDYCKKVCGDGPRSDEGKVLYVRKTLPPLELKDCPCVEKQQYNIPQPKLRRLPKPPFEDRPDWECRDYCKKVCGDGPRSDEGKELYVRKQLPPLELKDCPCVAKEPYNKPQPKLKRLPEAPFEDRPPWKCKEDVCADRADKVAGYDVKRKILPPMLYKSSKSSKKFSTLSDNFLYKENFTSFNNCAHFSLSSHLMESQSDRKECKKLAAKSKGKSCQHFKVSPCKPRARMTCKKESIEKECTKQKSPYPAFSECKDEDQLPPLTECGVSLRHLQPKWPIIDEIETQKPPPPHQGKIDPSREEECIIEKLKLKNEGGTKTCDTFNLPEKRLKTKEIMAEAMAQQKPVEDDSSYPKPTGDGTCPVVDHTTCGQTEVSYKPKKEKPRPSMICGKSEPQDCEDEAPKICEEKKDACAEKPKECEEESRPKDCEEESRPKDCPQPKKKVSAQTKTKACKSKSPSCKSGKKSKKKSVAKSKSCGKSKSKPAKKNPAKSCAALVKHDSKPSSLGPAKPMPKPCGGAKTKPVAPPIASGCPPRSFFERILDFFRARPNCPPPDQWKKDKLRKEAERAAAAAGMELCEKKQPKKACVVSKKVAIKDCRKVAIQKKKAVCKKPQAKKKVKKVKAVECPKKEVDKNKCKPKKKKTGKKSKGPCQLIKEDEELEEKPSKPCKQPAKAGGKICTLGPQECCEPKARESCKSVVKHLPCTPVEAPYPSFSECTKDFPKIPRTECSEQTKIKNRSRITNDYEMVGGGGKGKKKYSTWAIQMRYFSSNSNKRRPGDPFALLNITEENIKAMENNELAIRILSVIKEGMKKMSSSSQLNAKEMYYHLFKELEALCEQELERNEKTDLDFEIRPLNDGLFTSDTDLKRQRMKSDTQDLEQAMMVDAIKTFCRSIFSIPDTSTKSYEESERIKTEKLQKQLDEILDNYKAQ